MLALGENAPSGNYLAYSPKIIAPPYSKRLGDLAAGTVVVHADGLKRDKAGTMEPEEKGSDPPPLPLSLEEQQAIIEYHRRAGQLTEERALELAEIPLPLTEGLNPDQARRRLLRIGNFLLGRR